MGQSDRSAYGFPQSRFASVEQLADRIERDRREPDKIITYAQQLRGHRPRAGDSRWCWARPVSILEANQEAIDRAE